MNKYQLKKEPLEEGAYANIHLGKNLKKSETVAVKVLKKKYFSLEECCNNREVLIVKKLNHENVLKFIEVLNDDNDLLMVFEYLPENLKRVMKTRDKPFTEKETKNIMSQFLDGLAHVHDLGIMHRNLKPELLKCNEDASVVKISDFSTAKSINEGQHGVFFVNPIWYQAPEVILGSNTYTTPVDIWAAGCIMAELLTGKPLLQGNSNADLMYKICTLLGTFTKSEWPDGAMLSRQVDYKLPKSTQGVGLADVEATSYAKDMIIGMLMWQPEKRKTVKQCLELPFLFSEDGFISRADNKVFRHSTQGKLQDWKYRWEPELNRNSLEEFDAILAQLNSKPPSAKRVDTNKPFVGFGTTNPLLGDCTPRTSPRKTNPFGSSQGLDDPFRPNRSTNFDASPPQKRRNSIENEALARQDRRSSRQSIANGDLMLSGDDLGGPGLGELSRRASAQHQIQPPATKQPGFLPRKKPEDYTSDDRLQKAEYLKQTNPIKFRTIYGDQGMRDILGNGTAQQPGGMTGKGKEQDNLENIRNRKDDFHYKPSWADGNNKVRNQ